MDQGTGFVVEVIDFAVDDVIASHQHAVIVEVGTGFVDNPTVVARGDDTALGVEALASGIGIIDLAGGDIGTGAVGNILGILDGIFGRFSIGSRRIRGRRVSVGTVGNLLSIGARGCLALVRGSIYGSRCARALAIGRCERASDRRGGSFRDNRLVDNPDDRRVGIGRECGLARERQAHRARHHRHASHNKTFHISPYSL